MVFVGVFVFGCCLRTLCMYEDGCVLWVGFRIAGHGFVFGGGGGVPITGQGFILGVWALSR